MALIESSADELVALVGGLSSVRMADYAVVGSYMRFGERVREQLKDARLRIAEACATPAKRRDNHLLWAAPGSGKTYFVEQVAASLTEVEYVELNLAKLTEPGFRDGLAKVIAGGPTICLVDEVDAKPDEPWPYEALMPFLDVNLERGGGIVFVLAGSLGSTIHEFKGRIRDRPKGTDVLSRVPEANGWEIAPMDAGDRILVALSQMLNAAAELDRSIAGVEKLALHYLAAAPHLANARQLREFAVRAVERGSASSDRIRYDDLFDSGDPENKRYWASVMPQAEALVNSFVHIRAAPTRTPGSAADERNAPDEPRTRSELPTGTVTFLFTDVEGSTSLLRELGPEAYAAALADHRRVIREACTANGGVEVDTQGDAFFFAFPTAPGALAAASDFTERLATSGRIRVRVGVHTGAPLVGEESYVGHDVHRAARIAAAGHGGQVLVSAATARLVDAELTDLGEHRFKDLAAPERVYQLGGGAFPPLKSLYRVDLPIPATPFFGREGELQAVTELITRAGARLVTLTGPGGTGKTRLALEAASRAAGAFPDGVHWVALASLRDQEHVLSAIAQTLEIGGANHVDAIVSALSGKRKLVVLDNCEQLLPELASTIASLRDSTETLTILATSRERLQLSGEQAYAVPGLSKTEGPQLFAARAAAIGAAPTAMPAVAELCERLDELPLAIELAAARSVALSPEQLLERLGQRLDLLKGARDADPRQATLRATIQWSHDLLDESERRLFRELSVFRGGCTLEAAEAICGADLETLQSLLDKSLVAWRESGDDGRRYWMLETIREFAREELELAGDRVRLRDSHARWYAGAAERQAGEIRREDRAALEWVASEIDNLRAALMTRIEQEASGEAVVLAASIANYLTFVGGYREYLDALSRIEALSPLPSPELARLQRGAADSARVLGDEERQVALLAAAAATAEAAGDDIERWKTALAQGAVLHGQGNAEEGGRLMELAVTRLRELASGRTLASSLYTYGMALTGGGDSERALAMFGEALEISRHEGLDYGVAISTQGLAWAQFRLSNHPEALALSAESGARFADLGDREGVALSLGNAAESLISLDDPDLAATLWAAAMRILSELGLPTDPAGSEGAKRRSQLEESLGPTRLAQLVAAAGGLGDDDAIRLATEAAARFGSDSATATLRARG